MCNSVIISVISAYYRVFDCPPTVLLSKQCPDFFLKNDLSHLTWALNKVSALP